MVRVIYRNAVTPIINSKPPKIQPKRVGGGPFSLEGEGINIGIGIINS